MHNDEAYRRFVSHLTRNTESDSSLVGEVEDNSLPSATRQMIMSGGMACTSIRELQQQTLIGPGHTCNWPSMGSMAYWIGLLTPHAIMDIKATIVYTDADSTMSAASRV